MKKITYKIYTCMFILMIGGVCFCDGVDIELEGERILIGRIVIGGTTLLSSREKVLISEKYIGQVINKEVLGRLKDEVNETLIEKGFITTRGYIVDQEFENGVVVVEVEEGRVEKVDLLVGRRYTAFPQVDEGEVLNMQDLSQGVDQIGRMPSRRAVVVLWPGEKEGASIVKISEAIENPFRWYVGGDNQGSEEKREYRGKNILESDNLLGLNDIVQLTMAGNENEQSLGWSVSVPWGYWAVGYQGMYGPYEYSLKNAQSLKMRGHHFSQTVCLDRVLYRDAAHKLSLEGSFNMQCPKRDIDGNRLESKALRVIGLKLKNEYKDDRVVGELYGGYKKGLRFLGASIDDRGIGKEGTHAQFDMMEFGVDVGIALRSWLDFRTQLSLQYTWSGLPSSEQLSLSSFQDGVRGFDALAMSQDMGVCSRNDLTFKMSSLPYLQLNPYLFVDYGAAWNWGSRIDLASMGGGVKFTLFDRLSGEVNVAKGVYMGARSIGAYQGGLLRDQPLSVNFNLLLKVF